MTDSTLSRQPGDADDFDLYQRDAARTLNPALDANQQLFDAAAGMAEEAGEALAIVRKHLYQERPLDRDRLREELGDALWCLAAIATVSPIA